MTKAADINQAPAPAAEPAPNAGEAREIAPGLWWCRPPGADAELHPGEPLNAYALEDGRGWTLVDPGCGDDDTAAAWRVILAGPLGGKPVTRIIATSDRAASLGAAGRLCADHAAPLVISETAYLTARTRVAEAAAPADMTPALQDFAARAGAAAMADDPSAWPGMAYSAPVQPPPGGFEPLRDGAELTIGGRVWRVLLGGAGAEPACLWCADDAVVVAGAVTHLTAEAPALVTARAPLSDPVGAQLDAAWRMMAAIPDAVTVLPACGPVFTGLHARLDQLIAVREAAVEAAFQRAKKGCTVADVAKAAGAADAAGLCAAMAQLIYLTRHGRARMDREPGGAARFDALETAPVEGV